MYIKIRKINIIGRNGNLACFIYKKKIYHIYYDRIHDKNFKIIEIENLKEILKLFKYVEQDNNIYFNYNGLLENVFCIEYKSSNKWTQYERDKIAILLINKL